MSGQSSQIEEILNSSLSELASAQDLKTIENIRVAYLGKSGKITELLKQISSIAPENRKDFGAQVNIAKNTLSDALDAKKEILGEAELEQKLLSEKLDVTLSAPVQKIGKIHPVSKVISEITDIFASMGYVVAEGPEIENSFNNFSALNIPESHPARQMHDTFYIEQNEGEKQDDKTELVLRTHTSPVQIRVMSGGKPPFRCIAPGRTFRCDSDQTHSPMFHQIEGFVVDKNIHMGMLKKTLSDFLAAFFGVSDINVRFRSSFFPFTEPSAEVDIGCSRKDGQIKIGAGSDWLEVLGCGMIHPNVLRNAGIDPEEYSGFAFGMGVERLAMLKYGINDLRQFFENDQRFINHFGF